MRTLVALIAALGALAPAAGASAAIEYYSQMSPPPPPQESYGPQGSPADAGRHLSLPDPYVRKLAFLKQKLEFTRAHDGGRLTPEHAAALQRELDRLNREAAGRRD